MISVFRPRQGSALDGTTVARKASLSVVHVVVAANLSIHGSQFCPSDAEGFT
ncbi:hypothetical protein NKW43_14495 [Gluconobacter albidus]|uniref:hypothetical protein n=1 Tax=Gluconobacter albidus TaxID=318683 RepID=UPI0020A06F2A|nr:hypothetical protein [Gluconobacter albidus]MCP1274877.1 hypothetical protein [Gluconobacter albidus]